VTVPSGVILSVDGTNVQLFHLLHVRFLGENHVHSWTSIGDTFGIAPSLEATLLETRPGLQCWLVCRPWWKKTILDAYGLLDGGGSFVALLVGWC
jgi:hypothetical protein